MSFLEIFESHLHMLCLALVEQELGQLDCQPFDGSVKHGMVDLIVFIFRLFIMFSCRQNNFESNFILTSMFNKTII